MLLLVYSCLLYLLNQHQEQLILNKNQMYWLRARRGPGLLRSRPSRQPASGPLTTHPASGLLTTQPASAPLTIGRRRRRRAVPGRHRLGRWRPGASRSRDSGRRSWGDHGSCSPRSRFISCSRGKCPSVASRTAGLAALAPFPVKPLQQV